MTPVTKNRILHMLGFVACINGAWVVATPGMSAKTLAAMALLAAAAIGNVFGFVRANTWFH